MGSETLMEEPVFGLLDSSLEVVAGSSEGKQSKALGSSHQLSNH